MHKPKEIFNTHVMFNEEFKGKNNKENYDIKFICIDNDYRFPPNLNLYNILPAREILTSFVSAINEQLIKF